MRVVLCCNVCTLQPYDHLVGKARPLRSLACDAVLCGVTFSYGVLGQVWYLIVSIPDIVLLLHCKLPRIEITQGHTSISSGTTFRLKTIVH